MLEPLDLYAYPRPLGAHHALSREHLLLELHDIGLEAGEDELHSLLVALVLGQQLVGYLRQFALVDSLDLFGQNVDEVRRALLLLQEADLRLLEEPLGDLPRVHRDALHLLRDSRQCFRARH